MCHRGCLLHLAQDRRGPGLAGSSSAQGMTPGRLVAEVSTSCGSLCSAKTQADNSRGCVVVRPGGPLQGLLGPFPGARRRMGEGQISVPPGSWVPEFHSDSVSERLRESNAIPLACLHTCSARSLPSPHPRAQFPGGLCCVGLLDSPGVREMAGTTPRFGVHVFGQEELSTEAARDSDGLVFLGG